MSDEEVQEEPNSQNWITTEEYDEDNTEAPPRVSDLVQQKESEQELVTQQKQENEEEEVIQEVEETANEAPEEETVQEAFVSAAGNFLSEFANFSTFNFKYYFRYNFSRGIKVRN